jgi:hypothetical protein
MLVTARDVPWRANPQRRAAPTASKRNRILARKRMHSAKNGDTLGTRASIILRVRIIAWANSSAVWKCASSSINTRIARSIGVQANSW